MYYKYDDESVRFTGRFAPYGESMAATAAGSTIKITFSGESILLYFDTNDYEEPVPHIYMQVDSGALTESVIYKRLRIKTSPGAHVIKIIYKSSVEAQNRFMLPLVGRISFLGYLADARRALPEDRRKSMEFVGDSIKEGVLVDADSEDEDQGQPAHPHVDDVTSTYAYLTAQHFELRDLHMGYGAVGVTHGGLGTVPKATESYPYCFQNTPVTYGNPDYILINHGANDKWSKDPKNFINEYMGLLKLIRKTHLDSVIICLSAFCGAYPQELSRLVNSLNKENNDNIYYIDATLWVPAEPLHPLREGHKIIADKLIAELENRIKV